MLLSEAIRLGSTLGPQARGMLHDGKGGNCALGAGYLAAGIVEDMDLAADQTIAIERWQDGVAKTFGLPFYGHMLICPVGPLDCGEAIGCVYGMVTHLNDRHLWTFDQIAAWVEMQELRLGLAKRDAEGVVREVVAAGSGLDPVDARGCRAGAPLEQAQQEDLVKVLTS